MMNKSDYEIVKIGNWQNKIPSQICTNKDIFNEVFSLDTWNKIMTPDQRDRILQLLPPEVLSTKGAAKETIEDLLTRTLTRFDLNPLENVFQKLEQGHFDPEVVQTKKLIQKELTKATLKKRKKYQSKLLEDIIISRESHISKVKENQSSLNSMQPPPSKISKRDLNLFNNKSKIKNEFNNKNCDDKSTFFKRVDKRFHQELSLINKAAGYDDSSSEDEELTAPKKKSNNNKGFKKAKKSTTPTITTTTTTNSLLMNSKPNFNEALQSSTNSFNNNFEQVLFSNSLTTSTSTNTQLKNVSTEVSATSTNSTIIPPLNQINQITVGGGETQIQKTKGQESAQMARFLKILPAPTLSSPTTTTTSQQQQAMPIPNQIMLPLSQNLNSNIKSEDNVNVNLPISTTSSSSSSLILQNPVKSSPILASQLTSSIPSINYTNNQITSSQFKLSSRIDNSNILLKNNDEDLESSSEDEFESIEPNLGILTNTLQQPPITSQPQPKFTLINPTINSTINNTFTNIKVSENSLLQQHLNLKSLITPSSSSFNTSISINNLTNLTSSTVTKMSPLALANSMININPSSIHTQQQQQQQKLMPINLNSQQQQQKQHSSQNVQTLQQITNQNQGTNQNQMLLTKMSTTPSVTPTLSTLSSFSELNVNNNNLNLVNSVNNSLNLNTNRILLGLKPLESSLNSSTLNSSADSDLSNLNLNLNLNMNLSMSDLDTEVDIPTPHRHRQIILDDDDVQEIQEIDKIDDLSVLDGNPFDSIPNLSDELDGLDLDLVDGLCDFEGLLSEEKQYASFFSLIREVLCSTRDHRMTLVCLEKTIRKWSLSPSAAFNLWFMRVNDWNDALITALNFLAGNYQDIHPEEDFVPYIEYKYKTKYYQWIGAGRDSDTNLSTLCQIWFDNLDRLPPLKKLEGDNEDQEEEDDENEDSDVPGSEQEATAKKKPKRPLTPPPPRCITDWSVRPSTQEEKDDFQQQERIRFENPHKAFTYKMHNYESVVGPVKGVYSSQSGVTNKARGHSLLTDDRPPYVTILALVRDAVARLPNGEGTRSEICEMLRDSAFLALEASNVTLNSVVSGALDRLHYERDPCVRYDSHKKNWIYLHRDRTQEQFERLHHNRSYTKSTKSRSNTSRKSRKSSKTISTSTTSPPPSSTAIVESPTSSVVISHQPTSVTTTLTTGKTILAGKLNAGAVANLKPNNSTIMTSAVITNPTITTSSLKSLLNSTNSNININNTKASLDSIGHHPVQVKVQVQTPSLINQINHPQIQISDNTNKTNSLNEVITSAPPTIRFTLPPTSDQTKLNNISLRPSPSSLITNINQIQSPTVQVQTNPNIVGGNILTSTVRCSTNSLISTSNSNNTITLSNVQPTVTTNNSNNISSGHLLLGSSALLRLASTLRLPENVRFAQLRLPVQQTNIPSGGGTVTLGNTNTRMASQRIILRGPLQQSSGVLLGQTSTGQTIILSTGNLGNIQANSNIRQIINSPISISNNTNSLQQTQQTTLIARQQSNPSLITNSINTIGGTSISVQQPSLTSQISQNQGLSQTIDTTRLSFSTAGQLTQPTTVQSVQGIIHQHQQTQQNFFKPPQLQNQTAQFTSPILIRSNGQDYVTYLPGHISLGNMRGIKVIPISSGKQTILTRLSSPTNITNTSEPSTTSQVQMTNQPPS